MGANPKGGANLLFGQIQIAPKTAWKEEILTGGHTPNILQRRSATV